MIFETRSDCLWILSPFTKMMQGNACSHSYVQRSSTRAHLSDIMNDHNQCHCKTHFIIQTCRMYTNLSQYFIIFSFKPLPSLPKTKQVLPAKGRAVMSCAVSWISIPMISKLSFFKYATASYMMVMSGWNVKQINIAIINLNHLKFGEMLVFEKKSSALISKRGDLVWTHNH